MQLTKCYLIDIDECAEGTDDCHITSNATCGDTDGSFICTCRDGFVGNGTFCEGKSIMVNINIVSMPFQIQTSMSA